MFRAVAFMLYSSIITFVFNDVSCEQNCDSLGILIYEDLGCKPVKKNGENCPIEYKCDDFTAKPDSCLFRGKSYGLTQQIDNELTYPSCSVGCFCGNSGGAASFICAVLDCPEWLGAPIKPGCYRKYQVDKCCSAGMICPSEETPLAECEVGGKKYKEGEKIFPKDTCLKCVCDKNWSKNLEEPFCKRTLCNTQINYAEDLSNKCAPCYFKPKGETVCCPDTWICPTSTDTITKVNKNADSESDVTCVFGSKTLKLGEGFQRTVDRYGADKKIQCECSTPPLLTCSEI